MDTREALLLLIIVAGAFVMPLLSERIGWFTAPGEMLYGIVVANVLPASWHSGAFVTTLAQFGFLLLLFLAGLEIDFTLLAQHGGALPLRALAAVVGIQGAAFALVVLLGWAPIYALLLGALSVSLLLAVLQEGELARSRFGQTTLVVGAIGEFLSMIEVTAYDLVNRFGVGWQLAFAVLKLVLLLVVGYAAMRGLSAAMVRQPHWFARLFAERDTTELGIRAALALMLCFAAVAVLLHVEQILATFIAGAVCSFALRRRNSLTKKLMTMGQGFFLPVFFITVGMNLRLSDLLSAASLQLVLGLLLYVLFIRLLAAPLLRFAGLSWRLTVPAALLLSAPLTLLVAITQVAINLGQLDASTRGAVLAAAIASAVIFPLLARGLLTQRHVAPLMAAASSAASRRRHGRMLLRRARLFTLRKLF